MNLLLKVLLLSGLVLFLTGSVRVTLAEDDIVDDLGGMDDEEGTVEDEDKDSDTVLQDTDDAEEGQLTGSPLADTLIYFTKPATPIGSPVEFTATKLTEFLVNFHNKGDKDFIIESLDASFRYPMDFNFFIHNFTALTFNTVVAPDDQVTLLYSFISAEAFSGRSFGFTVNLAYSDAEGTPYREAVFNETVSILELDEGLDGETFFLYLFLAALVVLLLVLGQQFLSSFGKRKSSRKAAVEMGTSNPNDVDFNWLPDEMLQELRKSPKGKGEHSPRGKHTSPRQRTKRAAGSDD